MNPTLLAALMKASLALGYQGLDFSRKRNPMEGERTCTR
jgi:hypothetical protein